MRLHISHKVATAAKITIVSLAVAYFMAQMPALVNLHYKTVNTLFNLRGSQAGADTSIVIVALDDETIRSMPSRMPYPRSYYAKLVRNLSMAGARLIVFDIEFTESNTEHPEDDLQLAKAVSDAGNVVLAGKALMDMGSRVTNHHQVLEPIAPLLRSGASWGMVNVVEDPDGFIRKYLLYQYIDKKPYFALSLAAARLLNGTDRLQEPIIEQHRLLYAGEDIPLVSGNTMYINYLGPSESFRTFSLANVLDDESFDLPDDEDTDIFEQHKIWGTFHDKIVFVGASAEELQDNKLTPFFDYQSVRRKLPGVELHANALSTILRQDYLRDLGLIPFIILVLFFTILTCTLAIALRPFYALATILVLVLSVLALTWALFIKFSLIFNITMPILSIFFTWAIHVTYQAFSEQREKQRIRRTFQQYVAPTVVEKMLSTGEFPAYGGERKELSILFSDIRNFTKFSESSEPEIVVSFLQEYLSEMVEIIFKYGGTLDKFVGDEIMAIFGAPHTLEDHAERACRTALDMVDKLRQLQKKWSFEKKHYFNIGLGINSGKVIVGNLGSRQLFDYTVIGDQVNLASRLEGANKQYQTTAIISEYTYALVKDKAKVRELDLVRVMGRSQPVRIFELRGMDEIPQIEQDYIIDVYSEGLQAYRERRWSDALVFFRRILRYFPSDGPSRLYTIRCLDFLEKPAPLEWDGIFEFTQK